MSRLRILAVSVLTVAMLATSIGPAAAIGLGISISLPEVDLAVDLDGLDISLGLDLSAEELAWGGGGPTATMAHVAEAIGADDLHTNGITGQGVGIAIIDTGVADVAGLEDTLRGPDLSLDAPVEGHYGVDDYGHGTHLAGLIASDRPDARGIAPDASLLSLKVGAGNGAVDVSQTVAAIDWVVQHRDEHDIRVLVLAYGTDGTQDPQLDPLSHAVEVAWDHGIAVVVAVGNHGESSDPVVNPATNPNVIAVGAVDTHGSTRYSHWNPLSFSARGDGHRNPDILAPGSSLASLRVPGSFLDQAYGDTAVVHAGYCGTVAGKKAFLDRVNKMDRLEMFSRHFGSNHGNWYNQHMRYKETKAERDGCDVHGRTQFRTCGKAPWDGACKDVWAEDADDLPELPVPPAAEAAISEASRDAITIEEAADIETTVMGISEIRKAAGTSAAQIA